ncbi:MAG: hypothetical protein KME60_33460, partial [Cyanomargarita calcarea GSE-NOS-MK-12-04C]|nr:hypothetical protein [Cyanomargarita calcarea GSE-NOS-MK-12-04C]
TPGTRGPKFSWAARRPTPVNRIHVNQHIIRNNTKTGEREPVITVKRYDIHEERRKKKEGRSTHMSTHVGLKQGHCFSSLRDTT